MLERYAMKVARTVLRGGSDSNATPLPDVWDSARFTSIFLASSFSCSQTESTPAHTQETQSVSLS